jgi:hypothetical protein
MLFNPKTLTKAFKKAFSKRDWTTIRVSCSYATNYYAPDYVARVSNRGKQSGTSELLAGTSDVRD